MKKWVILTLALSTCAQATIVDRTVALVGKDVILHSDVEEILAVPGFGIQSRDDALNSLIDKAVLTADCKQSGNFPSETEVKQTISDIKKQNKLDDMQFISALQRSGTSLDAYEKQLGMDICKTRIVHGKIRGRVNITDDDVKKAYEYEYSPANRAELHLRDMLVKVDNANTDSVQKGKLVAGAAAQNLQDGKTWEAVLAEAKKSGLQVVTEDLGTLARKDLLASISDSVFAQGNDKIRGPVRTDDGFHVLEILERVEGKQIPLADVRNDLHKQLFEKEVERLLRQYVEEAKSSVYIDVIGKK